MNYFSDKALAQTNRAILYFLYGVMLISMLIFLIVDLFLKSFNLFLGDLVLLLLFLLSFILYRKKLLSDAHLLNTLTFISLSYFFYTFIAFSDDKEVLIFFPLFALSLMIIQPVKQAIYILVLFNILALTIYALGLTNATYRWSDLFNVVSVETIIVLFFSYTIHIIYKKTTILEASQEELKHLNATLEKQVAQRTRELEKLNETLSIQSLTDPLTGIYNNRKLYSVLNECIALYKRHPFNLALIMFDIDHFKRVNDTFGHLEGDAILKRVVQTVQKALRSTDLFVRYGGEEFIIFLEQSELEEASKLAEKLRKLIDEEVKVSETYNITASFGVSAYEKSEAIEAWLDRTDKALYQAKEAGRNCVKVAP